MNGSIRFYHGEEAWLIVKGAFSKIRVSSLRKAAPGDQWLAGKV
jgi:hypothetical protein